ncbi:MAG TPA: hypothetical protein VMV03_13230 [Spirochaetia bacterium]|nr:hypothetical protein [Spirochaetia bacterium]
MNRRVVLFLFPLLVAAAAYAQDISVAYVEGQVLVSRGAGWADASVGESLAADARLRLGAEGYLELQTASRSAPRIILSKAGTYSVASLLSTRRTMDAARVGPSLSGTFVKLVRGTTLKQSAVMGVLGRRLPSGDEERQLKAARIAEAERKAATEGARQGAAELSPEGPGAPAAAAAPPPAAAAAPPEPESPVSPALSLPDDAEEHLAAGRDLIASGDLDKATDELTAALGTASEAESPEVRYYLACARSLSGDTHGALKLVRSLPAPTGPSAGSPWADDFVIFKAKLLADANAFSDELAWLRPHGARLSRDPERAPVYWFLLALGYRGVGDVKREQQSLSKVVSLAGESDLGKAAARLAK